VKNFASDNKHQLLES